MTMNCVICKKYQNSTAEKPIAELKGMALSHIAPSDDGLAMRGRLVIEPKRHVTQPEELTPEEFSSMGILLRKAMILLKEKLGAEHVYFFRINDLVSHFHFHVVPRYPNTPKEFQGTKILECPDYPKSNPTEIQELSDRLRSDF